MHPLSGAVPSGTRSATLSSPKFGAPGTGSASPLVSPAGYSEGFQDLRPARKSPQPGTGLHQLVEIGAQALPRGVVNLLLCLVARGIDLLDGAFGNNFTRLAADFGPNNRLQILWPGELVQHGDGAVRQLIPDVYLRGNVHTVLGDGVDLFGRGLQPQIINEIYSPGQASWQSFFVPLRCPLRPRAIQKRGGGLDILGMLVCSGPF